MAEQFTYGGRGRNPRTVVVHGNCQVPYLARMLAAIDDWNDDYRFVAVLNHSAPGQPPADLPSEAVLRGTPLVLWQHEDRVKNPASLALRTALPTGVPEVRFPTYFLPSLWPFECVEPARLPAEPAYPWGRYPLGDLIGLEIARTGLVGPLAVAAYLDLSAQRMPDLQVRLERDVRRMRQHDSHCDVRLADFVLARFRAEHLFWTNGHVSRAAMVELAVQVADAMRPHLGGSAARARACLEAVNDFEGLGGLQLPIHPQVAETLGLQWYTLDRTWLWYDQHWNFFEYIERYIGGETSW